jgi:O-antigen/teichoic acid export membrane protein
LLTLLFGASIATAVAPFLFLILASNTIMVFRAYYFAQILFVEDSSKLMLIANLSHAAVAASLSLLLIPRYGAAAAAFALMMGHLVALTVYACTWRNKYVMQLPYADVALIGLGAIVAYAIMEGIDTIAGRGAIAHGVNIGIFGTVALATAWRFKILSINEIAKPIARALARRREGSVT